MKINNIKNNLKRVSATVLASLCMCPNLHAVLNGKASVPSTQNNTEHKKSDSSISTSNIIKYGLTFCAGCLTPVGVYLIHDKFFANKDLGYKMYKVYYNNATDTEEKKLIKALYDYLVYVEEHPFDKLKKIREEREENEEVTEKTIKLEDTIEYKLFNHLNKDEKNKVVDEFIKENYGIKDNGNEIQCKFADVFINEIETFDERVSKCVQFYNFYRYITDSICVINKKFNYSDKLTRAIEWMNQGNRNKNVFENGESLKSNQVNLGIIRNILQYFDINCPELVWFRGQANKPETLNGVENFKEFVLFLIKNGKLKPAYQQYADYFKAETNKINENLM